MKWPNNEFRPLKKPKNTCLNISNFDIFQDGTIGDDLVVKPISAKVRSHIQEDSAQYKSQPFAGMPFIV